MFILQTVDAAFVQTPSEKFVHVKEGVPGADTSFIIVKVFELFDHHHVSLSLITKVWVHSAGVKEKLRLFQLSVHPHPSCEYCTQFLGEGHAVLFILQVVAAAFVHEPSEKLVHVKVGVDGGVSSYFLHVIVWAPAFHDTTCSQAGQPSYHQLIVNHTTWSSLL